MPNEVIFDGFRIVLPLTPEARSRLAILWQGGKTIESHLPRLGLLMSAADRLAIAGAVRVLTEGIDSILSASDAAAEPRSKTQAS